MHNPELLNNTGVAQLIAENGVRVLAISPHVGEYARQVLQAQGVQVRSCRGVGGEVGEGSMVNAWEGGRPAKRCGRPAARPIHLLTCVRRPSWTGSPP